MQTDKDVLEQLVFIQKKVAHYTPKWIDRESIVHDIWIECEEKNLTPFASLIHHRCVDAIRAQINRSTKEQLYQKAESLESSFSKKDYVNDLINKSELSSIERRLIYYLYYQGHTLADAGYLLSLTHHEVEKTKASALLKLQRAARFLERKEL